MDVQSVAIFQKHALSSGKQRLKRSITRNKLNRAKLRKIGIKPLRFWVHQLKKTEGLEKVINKITKAL